MKLRRVETLSELREVMDFIDANHPGIFERGVRDFNYYRRRIGRDSPLQLFAEDDGGICAAVLGSSHERHAGLNEYAVSPILDFETTFALLVDALAIGVDEVDLGSFMSHESGPFADLLERLGFSPTLFLQFFGEDREEQRRRALRRVLKDYRPLYTGAWGPAVSAVIAINRVDHDLLAEISNALPTTLGNGFNMNRWAAGDGTRIRSPFTRFTRPRFIVSRHPRFIRSAEREIKEVGPQAESSSLLDVDAAVVPGATPGRALDHAFAARPPTFVRHVAPVQVTVSLDGTRDDLSRLLAAVDLAAPMDLDASFCVECRKAPGSVSGGPHGTSAYSCRDVEIAIGSALEGRGYVVDLDRPLQVISVYLEGRDRKSVV